MANPSKPPSARPPKPEKTPEERVHRKDLVGQIEGEALEATVGAVAGAVVGAMAGPVGAAAGAAVGGAIGVALAHQMRREGHEAAERDRALDAGEIEAVEVPDEEALPGKSVEELERELEKK